MNGAQSLFKALVDAGITTCFANPGTTEMPLVAALEGGRAALASASGMAAEAMALMTILQQGDHVVASDTLYGGTWAMLAEFLPRKCGITTTFVDATDPEAIRNAITITVRQCP